MRFDSSSLNTKFRGARMLAVSLAVIAFAACSTIKLGYNNADMLLLHQVNRYVSLTSEQETMVKHRVANLMAWHRATQLQDYAAFVQRTRTQIDGDVTPAEVVEFNQGVNVRLVALGDKAAPDVAALALSLSPQQIDQIESKLRDDNVKARKENAREMKQAIDERAKKYAERTEFWFGRLSPEQVQLVKASLAGRPVDSLYWIEARERRSRDFIALLRRIEAERPTDEVAARWVRSYFAELANPRNADQRARAESFRRDNADLIAQLLNSASPEQRAHLDRRLSGFASEFVQLAHRGGAG